jgi:malonyl-CoA O-methyltransferase
MTVYNELALHFDKHRIPGLVQRYMQGGPYALADLGCGDGPWFNILAQRGHISQARPVYAVDLQPERIERARRRFPWIAAVVAPVDDLPQIASGSLDWVISTMVMEHVPLEVKYLREIHRILAPGGKAYLTTVYKRRWAWYFRKRNGQSVLDTSHLREYTNLDSIRTLIAERVGFTLLALELQQMWFPLFDPLLFRLQRRVQMPLWLVNLLRLVKVPVPGYHELQFIIQR